LVHTVRSGDDDRAVLQRLAERLKNPSAKLRKLVHKEDSVMSKGDLTG